MTDERSPLERTRVALWALADDDARVAAPRHLDAAVMRAWDEQHRQPRRARPWWAPLSTIVSPVMARAVLVSAAALTLFWFAVPGVFRSDDAASGEPGATRLDRGPFLPVAEVAPLQGPSTTSAPVASVPTVPAPEVPAYVPRQSVPPLAGGATVVFVGEPFRDNELARVIRMRVMREALASLGVSARSGAESVDVDVVVGEDGVARGLRVGM